jgi:hypothetical protein
VQVVQLSFMGRVSADLENAVIGGVRRLRRDQHSSQQGNESKGADGPPSDF